MISIRTEAEADLAGIRDVSLAAFPTAAEADLVDALRRDPAWLPELSLVAEADGRVVGHLLMTRAHLVRPDGMADEPIFAPLEPGTAGPQPRRVVRYAAPFDALSDHPS